MKRKVLIPKPIRLFLELAQQDLSVNGSSPEKIARLKYEFQSLLKTIYFYRDVNNVVDKYITPQLTKTYSSQIERGDIFDYHKGVSRLRVSELKPELQDKLRQRIQANKQLITDYYLDTETKAVNNAVANWLNTTSFNKVLSDDIIRGIVSKCDEAVSTYDISRRAIDQSHKLIADFNAVIADDAGAVAGQWHSHKKTATYMARPEHEKLNNKIYVIKNSWAVKQGLLKKGSNDWLEDLKEQPAQLINCTCYFVYFYEYDLIALFKLKPEIFTEKGKAFINAN
jgi:hypothetical protein